MPSQKVPTTLFSGHFSHSSKFNFCSRGVNGVKKCWFKRSAEWNFLTLLSANSSLCRVYCTSEQYTYRQQLPTAAGEQQWGQKVLFFQIRIWISKYQYFSDIAFSRSKKRRIQHCQEIMIIQMRLHILWFHSVSFKTVSRRSVPNVERLQANKESLKYTRETVCPREEPVDRSASHCHKSCKFQS